jgi:hypothetical protein
MRCRGQARLSLCELFTLDRRPRQTLLKMQHHVGIRKAKATTNVATMMTLYLDASARIALPQFGQNLESEGTCLPHSGHAGILTTQSDSNLMSSASRKTSTM